MPQDIRHKDRDHGCKAACITGRVSEQPVLSPAFLSALVIKGKT